MFNYNSLQHVAEPLVLVRLRVCSALQQGLQYLSMKLKDQCVVSSFSAPANFLFYFNILPNRTYVFIYVFIYKIEINSLERKEKAFAPRSRESINKPFRVSESCQALTFCLKNDNVLVLDCQTIFQNAALLFQSYKKVIVRESNPDCPHERQLTFILPEMVLQ